jgi:hypothetical protein
MEKRRPIAIEAALYGRSDAQTRYLQAMQEKTKSIIAPKSRKYEYTAFPIVRFGVAAGLGLCRKSNCYWEIRDIAKHGTCVGDKYFLLPKHSSSYIGHLMRTGPQNCQSQKYRHKKSLPK